MAKILVFSNNSTTSGNMKSCLTNLGHTVTVTDVITTSDDYTVYDLVCVTHYNSRLISLVKSQIIDLGVPILFSSQGDYAGAQTSGSTSLAVYLALAKTDMTTTGLSTYVANDYNNILSNAGVTYPMTISDTAGYQSYLQDVSGNAHIMAYTSSGNTTQIRGFIFDKGALNQNNASFNASIGFLGGIGSSWNTNSSWQSLIGAYVTYLLASITKYYVSGTVKDSTGKLVERTVSVYDRDTLALVSSAKSTDGAYKIRVSNRSDKTYFIVCLDTSDGKEASLIKDKVTALAG